MGVARCGERCAQLQQAVDLTLKKRPALRTVVEPFGAALLERTFVVEKLHAEMADVNLWDHSDRLSSGTPVMSAIPPATLKTPVGKAATDLLPILEGSFKSLAAEFGAIEKYLHEGVLDMGRLGKAYLDSDEETFRSTVQDSPISAEALKFVVYWALSAVLQAARLHWSIPDSHSAWSKSECAFCGSGPGLASLSRPPETVSEFFTAGGGQRYLHCALCGHQWRFERNRCPSCHANGKDDLVYYQESAETGERIYACRKCNRYLLCIDLRQRPGSASMDLAALGMVHLDILAQGKGYRPIARVPWNRIDP